MNSRLILDGVLLKNDLERFQSYEREIHTHLSSLSTLYPAFDQWYAETVAPALKIGTRKIVVRFRNRKMAGIAIVKDDLVEKKLCCLRVLPLHQGSGLGLRLFDDTFELLGTSKPLLSVAEEHQPEFQRVFDHFGFETGRAYRGLYRDDRTEFSFNGELK